MNKFKVNDIAWSDSNKAYFPVRGVSGDYVAVETKVGLFSVIKQDLLCRTEFRASNWEDVENKVGTSVIIIEPKNPSESPGFSPEMRELRNRVRKIDAEYYVHMSQTYCYRLKKPSYWSWNIKWLLPVYGDTTNYVDIFKIVKSMV